MLVIVQQIVFILVLLFAVYKFSIQAKQIIANIKQGRPENRNDNPKLRWKNMLLLALGQKKMFKNWIPAVLHFFVYVGFILINIEVLEIVLDGILGTHRLFLPFLGKSYTLIISFFELLAVAVLVSCAIFLFRRNVLHIHRFQQPELKGWAWKDANTILTIEIVLMIAVLLMNAADLQLQKLGNSHYHHTGSFLVSSRLMVLFNNFSMHTLVIIERLAWWAHILGILAFLNYLPFSKHLHIILAFPNSYFGDLNPKGKIKNMPSITQEVQLMFNPNMAVPANNTATNEKFGAKDINDLSWKNLLDAYSCTECGRCTNACPANITGKLLSPRKIMMDTRDRMEDLAKYKKQHGNDSSDGKTLLYDYITAEEIKACTTCNACVEECPVSINPLNIIIELRRYMILEDSKSPEEWNLMYNNLENNGAVWKFSPEDRANWALEV